MAAKTFAAYRSTLDGTFLSAALSGRTFQPLIPRRSSPLPSAAHPRPHIVTVGSALCADLVPAGSLGYVEDADISSGQEGEWCVDEYPLVKLGTSRLSKTFKPCREHEIGNQRAIDLITELVVFARVAHFVRVQRSTVLIGLQEHRQVNLRVAQHFEQFVACGDCPLVTGLQIAPREDLP